MLLFLASGAALGALLGRSWPLLALSWRLLGRSWLLPGRSWEPFSSPGRHRWELFGSLFPSALEKHENLDFRRQLQRKSRFGRPRGVQNRAKMAPKSLLGASWRLLALSWRLSALSLASLAGLLALLGPLGRLLGRSWGDFKLQDKIRQTPFGPFSDLNPALIPTAFPPRHSPFRG